jgi:hypothetical protein
MGHLNVQDHKWETGDDRFAQNAAGRCQEIQHFIVERHGRRDAKIVVVSNGQRLFLKNISRVYGNSAFAKLTYWE